MYTPTYQKPYPNGYQNTPNLTTPIMAAFLNNIDSIIGVIEDYLADNPILDLTDIAPAYDNTSTYAVDDIVSHEGKIYQCNTTISTAEEFDSTKWTEISLGDVYASKAIYTDTGIHMGSGSFSETGSGVGSGNTVLSDYGFAAGYGNALYAGATDSVALGRYCTIDLYGSVAIGNSINLHGTDDFGIGYNHDVQGSYSGAIGMNVTIDSGHSIGIGNDLLVGPSYQTVLGNFNVKDTNNLYALIVGIGTSDNSRRNGLTLSKSGDLQVGGDVVTGSGNSLNKAAEDFLYYENNGFLSKNKLPLSLESVKTLNTSGTWNDNVYSLNGIDFTVNTNAYGNITSVKANGTASARADFYLLYNSTGLISTGSYILSGCPITGSDSTYRLHLYNRTQNSNVYDYGSGSSFSINGTDVVDVLISVFSGYQANNKYFAPMIRSSRITDSTFMPYSPSNDDLDEAKIDKTASKILAISDGQFTTVTGGLMQSCVVELEPVQSGSGTPSPENIRPIAGHTTADLHNVGKNLTPSDVGTQTTTGITFTPQIDGSVLVNGRAEANTSYYLVASGTSTLSEYLEDGQNYILTGCPSGGSSSTYSLQAQVNGSWNSDNGDGASFSYASGGADCLRIFIANGTTVNNLVFKPMIRLATDTDSTFEPYQGKTYSTTFGQTVYGGTVDLVSGEMTVTHATVNLGDYNWYAHSSTRWYTTDIRDFKQVLTVGDNSYGNAISNAFDYRGGTSLTDNGITLYYNSAYNGYRCFISASSQENASASDFKQWLNDIGASICYELATPIVIQLTPTEINTIIGSNTITAPLSGQCITQATYRELMVWNDVESVTESKADTTALAPNESGNTVASQAYAVGEYFYKDGYFCEVTTAIAQGGTLTENTNYTKSNVADALNKVEDITDEFTFSTDCTWNTSWTQIYKAGKIIKGTLRFTTPSTVSGNKVAITVPTKYLPKIKDTYIYLGTLSATWNGEIKGLLTFNGTSIMLAASDWVANTQVLATFSYVID